MTNPAEPLRLTEYETSGPVSLTSLDLELLESAPAGWLTVLASAEPGHVRIRASSWVGTLVLATTTVVVRPKVPDLRNVMLMMAAGAGITEWSDQDVEYGTDDLSHGVAELIVRAIDAATHRGLVHGYVEVEDRLQVLRGRLLIGEIARKPWEPAPIPCRFEEFTEDIAENRVFKTCISEIAKWPLTPLVRRRVRVLLQRLEAVRVCQSPLRDLASVSERPTNAHYTSALMLCRMFFEGSSVLHSGVSVVAEAFMVDMNSLFEAWIGVELRRRLFPELEVHEQAPTALSSKPKVWMRPDLVMRRSDRAVYVADVKYKLSGSGLARTPDYYQLLAYATVMGLRSGTLIYCQSDDAPPREIVVHTGGQVLRCYPVSLAGSWNEVTASLDDLAQHVNTHASDSNLVEQLRS